MGDRLEELLKKDKQRKTITDAAAEVERLRQDGKTITEIVEHTGLPRKMVNAHMRGYRTKQQRGNNNEQ